MKRHRPKPPLWEGEEVPIRVLLDVTVAAHLSNYVDSKWPNKGGLLLVGPPGVLKSTIVNVLDNNYADALILSDLNAQSLGKLRSKLNSGAFRTLVLPELGKLYERNPATAANVEGVLRALVEEGFASASWEDATVARLRSRAVVIGAMVPDLRDAKSEAWDRSGFSRRFLWSLFQLKDPEALDRAVVRDEMLDFGIRHLPMIPSPPTIPNLTTAKERQLCRLMLKHQPHPHTAQLQFLVKILAVLKWSHTTERRRGRPGGRRLTPMETISYFARTLGKHGAEVIL